MRSPPTTASATYSATMKSPSSTLSHDADGAPEASITPHSPVAHAKSTPYSTSAKGTADSAVPGTDSWSTGRISPAAVTVTSCEMPSCVRRGSTMRATTRAYTPRAHTWKPIVPRHSRAVNTRSVPAVPDVYQYGVGALQAMPVQVEAPMSHTTSTVPDSKEWNEILKLFPLLV
jgi:hypothetical protein